MFQVTPETEKKFKEIIEFNVKRFDQIQKFSSGLCSNDRVIEFINNIEQRAHIRLTPFEAENILKLYPFGPEEALSYWSRTRSMEDYEMLIHFLTRDLLNLPKSTKGWSSYDCVEVMKVVHTQAKEMAFTVISTAVPSPLKP